MVGVLALLSIGLAAGPHAPSESSFIEPSELGRALDCAACHEEQYAQWRRSAHAHSSLDNPWYLSSFQALRDEVGVEASRVCGGCHDPVLLATGALDGEVGPDHRLASEGVACLVCHGITGTGPAGNGDYRVDLSALPDPVDSVRKHRQRMASPAIADGTVCRGCHRGFLTPESGNRSVLAGFDDWGEWEASGWAGRSSARLDEGGAQPQSCVDCHFANGHGSAGGRTALAALTGGLDEVSAMLGDAVQLSIPVVRVDGSRIEPSERISPPAGAEVELDVAVHNTGAGHSFPGGLADAQDIWLRVRIEASSGVLVAGQDSDRGVHFRSAPLDIDGRVEGRHRTHRIAASGFDHSIPPGEVGLVRVGFRAPGGLLSVRAELVHRSHRPELHQAACAVSGPQTLDGCQPQRARVIATASLKRPGASALYVHALGISRGLHEDLGQGLLSLRGRTDPASRVLRARILGLRGQANEALHELDGLDPAHPAVWRARGDALGQVWRWSEAAAAYAELSRLAPRDPASFRDLARALGSAGEHKASLEAADRGLSLNPRHPELLRSRALALQALSHPDVERATRTWLAHRIPEDAGKLRTICDHEESECKERAPIPSMRAK